MTTLHRIALACTIATATAFAALWAIRMPLLAEPDELAHADYAFELYDIGRPFVVANALPKRTVTPQARYLERAVRYRENRYAMVVRLPNGYGTADYFDRVDRDAPQASDVVPAAGSPLPYVMFSYPVGYYVMAALAMRAADLSGTHSLTRHVFAARFIGVACLPLTLLLAYGVFIRLRLTRPTALLATAAVGLMPLTLWVSGYIQPDVATTLFVTAAVYASLRWKDAPQSRGWPLGLAASLIALAFVKQHYAAATLVATMLQALTTAKARRRFATIAATFAAPVIALVVATRVGPAGPIGTPHLAATTQHALPLVTRLTEFTGYALIGLQQAFAGGDAFKDFWWLFGLNGISVIPHGAVPVVRALLLAITLGSLIVFVIRLRFVGGALVRIRRGRSGIDAVRLFAGDPIANVYLLVCAMLVAVYALSNGSIWLEGRYWLPVIVPFAGFVLTRNLRAFPLPARRRAAFVVAGAWAAYSIVTAPLGVEAIEHGYYDRTRATPAVEPYAEIRSLHVEPPCVDAKERAREIRRGCAVRIEGYAVDGSRGLPATTVFITVDAKRTVRARMGAPSPAVKDAYNDDELGNAGFSASLDTRSLTPGRHTIGLLIGESDAFGGAPLRASFDHLVVGVR